MKYQFKSFQSIYTMSFALVLIFTLFSCDGSKTQKKPINLFEGVWELQGRSMFDGIQIKIEAIEEGFEGHVIKLNDNKYVQLFMEEGDQWVSGIRRTSNFEFIMTEQKLGKELFSMYGLDAKQDFKVQFIDDNTFGLSKGSAEPKESKLIYKRAE